jgi:hypothetical protein
VGAQAEQLIQREIVKENTRQITDIDIETIFEVEEEDDDNNDDKDRNGPDSDYAKEHNHPYCDLVAEGYKGTCHDRQDYSDDTGLAPCRDGSNVEDYKDCKDAGEHPDEVKPIGKELADVFYDDKPEPEPTLFGSSTSTPTTPTPTPAPAPTPNALERGQLPTTPSPTLDNPCDAIPEPDIPECKDLPAETPEPTPLPPTPETLLNFPTEEIEEIPNVPLEDTVEEEVEEEEPEEPEEEEPEEETAEEESGSEGESSE